MKPDDVTFIIQKHATYERNWDLFMMSTDDICKAAKAIVEPAERENEQVNIDEADNIDEAYNFVDSMIPRADIYDVGSAPAWHGWALREAFLKGIEFAEAEHDKR